MRVAQLSDNMESFAINYVSMFFIPQIALAIRLLSSSLGVGDRGICRSVGVVLLGFSRGFNALLKYSTPAPLGCLTCSRSSNHLYTEVSPSSLFLDAGLHSSASRSCRT